MRGGRPRRGELRRLREHRRGLMQRRQSLVQARPPVQLLLLGRGLDGAERDLAHPRPRPEPVPDAERDVALGVHDDAHEGVGVGVGRDASTVRVFTPPRPLASGCENETCYPSQPQEDANGKLAR